MSLTCLSKTLKTSRTSLTDVASVAALERWELSSTAILRRRVDRSG